MSFVVRQPPIEKQIKGTQESPLPSASGPGEDPDSNRPTAKTYFSYNGKESEVAQPCPTLCNAVDYSLPGSSVHGIFPGKSTGVGCYFLPQGIFFPTQQSNPGLPHCRQSHYRLSHKGSPSLGEENHKNKYHFHQGIALST